ncbi:hypothetical protein GWN26_03580, partial [Candidatus Saccharibacteria bacterium]|nr:hypothetical protein [Candidatus Saccharibacteria bacterium]NIV03426.1 hypothetical protein [Calditrichia bacterium]NIV71645.1 hypothetical protein [Calditrichia bacterium]NIV98264.1 hypothetical protein [Candidatus Saccharibacteria bacterium]NIW78527.1 hypothetical protein [Calditrichia bacterium]
YMLIVGDKEVDSNTVSVRHKGEGDKGTMAFEEFLNFVTEENNLKK